jgi:hypothetical protein
MAAPISIDKQIRTNFGRVETDQNSTSIEVDSRFWRMIMTTSEKKTS